MTPSPRWPVRALVRMTSTSRCASSARHTSSTFVFDSARRLAYTGKIDDHWQDAGAVKQRFLREALDDLLAGRQPRVAQTHAIGCTIKWKG